MSCSKEDTEFLDSVKSSFSNYEVIESSGFDGIGQTITVVVPLIALSIQAIDFVLTHLCEKKDKGRILITKKGNIIIEGYSKNEIVDVLKNLCDTND
jgi:hypothetical protein